MSSRQNLKLEKIADHESIFLDRYAWLLDRALPLTRGSKDQAEDLVQDLYVRFVFSHSDIDVTDDERLKGYLYRALQNLSNDKHRRRGRDPLSNLQTVDYDTMESALSGADNSRLLYVRSDLAGICEYACARRMSSRAGSVLILRFILGYFPSEIVALLRTTPAAVYKLVESARLEAKVFLKLPGSLHFPGSDSIVKVSFTKLSLPDDPASLFVWLHNRVFEAKEGECFTSDALELLYSANSTRQLTTREVGHLVSCQDCLERANHLLHFPELSKRFPDDPNDRGSNPPSTRSSGNRTVAAMRKKLRAAREHRPKTLEIAVDGHVHGAQKVTSALSRFQILLEPSTTPKYISILSEQGHSLLYVDLQHQGFPGFYPLRTEIPFSDERFLVLELNPSASGSVIELTYYDPALEVLEESWIFEEERLPIFQPRSVEIPDASAHPVSHRQLWRRLLSWLSNAEIRFHIGLFAALGMAAILALALPWRKQPRIASHDVPGAISLLAQSERTARIAIPVGGASRRTFALEVRDDRGKVIESATVQELHDDAFERRAIRMVGADHKLLAGRWSDASGKSTTYTPKDGMRHQAPDKPAADILNDAWSQIPEASDFDRLIGKVDKLRVERRRNDYQLVYGTPQHSAPPSLIYADIVLSGTDLHPTSETLRLRRGKVTREYHFRELTYEILRADQVVDGDFDPSVPLSDLRSSLNLNPGLSSSTHLTLEALQLLNSLGPDVERIVNLERRSDGTVELNGVFPTSVEKTSVSRVFQSLKSGNQLKIDLHSSDEPVPSRKKEQPVSMESLESIAVDTRRIPFDDQIRPILAHDGLAETSLEDRIRTLSRDVTFNSAELHREGWSIAQIAGRDFSLGELRSMAPEDKTLWLTLLEKHIHSFNEHLVALRAELAPYGQNRIARLPNSQWSVSLLHNIGELEEAAIILNHDSERLDRLLTTGFTLSPSSLPENYNFADAGGLMSDLETEEKTLQGTIERLHKLRQAEAKN
ncbi:RNA polymerase sigma factor [Granulicella sp. L60]|uniref:RNA polymerase sigma factor n=1 Tax=Granulicella sp. L60 TaxID=1641866 RepID=UPI00131C29C4|nr:sigma factor [Granulicella sp. L60]